LRGVAVFGNVRAASRRAVAPRRHVARAAAIRSAVSQRGFQTMSALWLIVLCGVLAVLYAVWAIRSVLASDPGSARMQEIAAPPCGKARKLISSANTPRSAWSGS